MSVTESQTSTPLPPERLAEASVWIAKLHGDTRGRALENGLRRWLLEDPDNARAFELATEVWEEAAHLRRLVPFHRDELKQTRLRWRPMLAAVSCAMLLVIGGVIWSQYWGMISTAVGEQRHLVLEDGTRVFLNTDTRIVVKFDDQARRVELRRGEALFNVAKRSAWPFIVVAGDRQVRALGTSFVIRKDVQQLAVTLVEGSVLVAPAAAVRGDSGEFKLKPGQRLTFGNDASPTLDTPSVERVTAWRRGQVILEDTPLQAAVAEMNRYNETKLVVQQPEIAALLINGLFQAGDSSQFANAVAQAYGLTVIERGNEIVLSGKPAQ